LAHIDLLQFLAEDSEQGLYSHRADERTIAHDVHPVNHGWFQPDKME
jgi:hypothetical protein